MKKTYIILGMLIVGGLFFVWYKQPNNKHAKEVPTNSTKIPTQIPGATQNTKQSNIQPSVIISPEERRKRVEAQEKAINLLMATPIVFHGRVVDETGQPIEGATITLSPENKIWGDDPKYLKTSDKEGKFSIVTHGLGIVVSTEKKGYYELRQSGGVFGYVKTTSQYEPHQHADNPAVFVLRKMGITEPLIKIDKNIRISKKGDPVEVDLTTGRVVAQGQGDIKIESWTHDENISNPNLNIPYDWQCRISVPNGGITKRTGGEFEFEAPDSGYKPMDIIDEPATLGEKWKSQISRQYYLKLRTGKYVRLDFMMTAGGQHFFSITSFLNPSGSRNLEFDPDKQINR